MFVYMCLFINKEYCKWWNVDIWMIVDLRGGWFLKYSNVIVDFGVY